MTTNLSFCPHYVERVWFTRTNADGFWGWMLKCKKHWSSRVTVHDPDCELTANALRRRWMQGRITVCRVCDSAFRIHSWIYQKDYVVKKPASKPPAAALREILKAEAEKGSPLSACPTLVEWLAAEQWEDKTERKTSTLLINVENGRWKGRLCDRDSNKVLWSTSDTISGLLEGFESDLTNDTGDWRDNKFEPGKKK